MEPERRPRCVPASASQAGLSQALSSQGSASRDARQWQRIRAVLEQALALPEQQRGAFVDRECGGNESARAEVLSLLRASEQTGFLDAPATFPELNPALPPGTRVGHFEIVHKIGEGGMGVVYEALDPRLNRRIALKVMSNADGPHEERMRFLREARAASALNHPNIVTIYEYDSAGDRDFIAMEFIEGKTLRELIDERNLPLATGLGYARQVASALARAHGAGIVHRDLKPQNIMVTPEGTAKILDFGLARRAAVSDQSPEDSTTLTRVGVVVGTPAYMSPEQILGEAIDARSDIFSFGIVLYEIVTGKQPFRAGNPQATMHHITSVAPPQIDTGRSVPRDLAQFIDLCLAKKPEDRLQSMTDAVERLSAVRPEPARGRVFPRRSVLGSVAALGAAVIGGVWYSHRPAARTTAVVAPAPAAPVSKLVLTSSLEAQQLRNGKPIGEPQVTSGDKIFDGPWRFRLRAQPEESGYLYMVDEGPDQNGVQQLTVLYPGEPLTAGQSFESKWYRLEGKPGTERLWIVWSKQPVPQFDQNDPSKVRALLDSVRAIPQTSTTIELRGSTDVVAALLELQHR
jgi:predicted Ser/Thr protein kinase